CPHEGGNPVALASHHQLGDYQLFCADNPDLLFTDNETNNQHLFNGTNENPYVKDGINQFVLHGNKAAVNADGCGTKMAADYALLIAAGETHIIRLRLARAGSIATGAAFTDFEAVFDLRRQQA